MLGAGTININENRIYKILFPLVSFGGVFENSEMD